MLDPGEVTALGAYGGCIASYTEIFMSDLNFILQLAGPVSTDFSKIFPSMVCRVGDQGVRVIIQVTDFTGAPVIVRNASAILIKLLKPDGTTVDIAGVLLTNGYDGKIYLISTLTIPPFDQSGQWFLQAEITIGGTKQSTEWGSFNVEGNIDNA
jgi:hypothetical protein